MNEERLRELLDEAIVDCYDEEEEFWGIVGTLEDRLSFPLSASLLNLPVQVVGIDASQSNLRRGIMAQVEKDGDVYAVNLVDLEFGDVDAESAEWLAMVMYWLTPWSLSKPDQ